MHGLSAIIISPDISRRPALLDVLTRQAVSIAREFSQYPSFDDLLKATSQDCHVVVVDLVPDVEAALSLVEQISASDPGLTVMVYSASNDPQLLMRSMRAGAREFLTQPVSPELLKEAFARAAARLESSQVKKATGKILLFAGAKGGAGVTTLASNFALALKQESESDVTLVDLDLHLGDVSVLLGLTPRYNVLDALRNGDRMDADLVSTLMVQHKSGLAILAGPDEYHPVAFSNNGDLRKLLRILRGRFRYVVIDGGSGLGTDTGTLLELADVVYLVTQVDIPSLRNAQRMISHIQKQGSDQRSLEIVLNRFESRSGIDQEQIEKALTATVKWKIPNDFAAARGAHNAGTPLVLQKSPLSSALHHMARAACGKAEGGKRKVLGLFG